MKHVSTFSLGGGSWLTARVVQRELVNPGDEHVLLFADTLYEDADAYRFGIEAAANIFDRRVRWVPAAEDFPDYRVAADVPIEEYTGNPAWRAFLAQLRDRAAEEIPELVWLVEGRDPWEVFRSERLLGNSRFDPCSKFIKRKTLDRWFNEQCDPAQTIRYYGIGTGEKHRYDNGEGGGLRPRMEAMGWRAEAPLIGRVEGDLSPLLYMSYQHLKPPRLYGLGYQHNNCGGLCVKAGHRHWRLRHDVQPERFAYDAMMEEKIRVFLGADVSFLTDRRGGTGKKPFTLAALAERLGAEPQQPIPDPEPGENGCGCVIEEAA